MQHVKSELLGPDDVDVRYLAWCLELKIPVVTDDADMIKLAKEYDIEVWPILILLKKMLDSGHTSMPRITAVVEYLKYASDLPSTRFMAEYKRFFDSSNGAF